MGNTNPYHKRYKFVQKIGEGSYGTVFKVKDTQSNNFKAQKKIEIIDKEEQIIKSEVDLLKKLNHENIIHIYDSYIDTVEVDKRTKDTKKYLHILMQLVEGDMLVKRLGNVDEKLFINIYDQLKDVFQYLDSKNIIHRDIKLDNIMITKNNKIKLIDFGIACQLIQLNTIRTKKARGHDYYKAPQINMDSKASKKSDLWSVGIILIQLYMGKLIEKIYDENQIVGYPSTKPGELIKFLNNSNIKKSILNMILPLVEEDYHKRQFYLDCLNLKNQKLEYPYLKQKLLKFRYINQLNISNCNLQDDSLELVSITCKQLKILNASGNKLTDKSIMYLKENKILRNLIVLNIAFTNITDQSLLQITKYGQFLQSLDISYTRVTSKSIITLSQLKKLSSLAIWSGLYYPSRYYEHICLNIGINLHKYIFNDINITKDCIKQISKIRLKQLTINQKQNSADEIINRMEQDSGCVEVICKLSNQNIEKIVGMKALKRLYLQGVKDYGFKELKSKKLESVGLVNSNIVIKELVNYLSYCEQLRELNLYNNKIGVQGATAIANRLTNLTTLDLSWNNIGDQGATAIANRLTNLTTLILWNNNIGDQGATAIANRLTNLTTLDLNNNNIGVQGATAIANRLTNLTTLYLYNNNINESTKKSIRQRLKHIKLSL